VFMAKVASLQRFGPVVASLATFGVVAKTRD